MFPAVPSEPDFVALELDVLDQWRADRVFERSIEERQGAADYVFYEGPPTANGKPGLHHVWARVYKDVFCRYQTMRGRRVLRRAGWDTHGLPVEVQVEKALGLTNKRQIEEFGIDRFVELCRSSVHEYVDDWRRLTERIGFWVDFDGAYWTLDPAYVDSVWWHLATLWRKGLLYEDVKVTPYCPRCGTSLSSHELGQPDVYQDVDDEVAFVRLPITNGEGALAGASLVVWTTTPWTLPSNTGVAVDAELDYVVVDGLVVAAARADAVLGDAAAARTAATVRGADLVGLRYQRPVDAVPLPPGAQGDAGWRVVAAEFVSADEGTGLVHIAPAFGSDDWLLGRNEGLPTLNPVGPDGRFTDEAGWLAGMAVKEADPAILDDLDRRDLLVRREPYRHSYPHCWRCGTPLIYWGKPSWYVATSRHKADLVAANETINWRPDSVKHGRFGEWLHNNVDWALSRDRYWGTPLPIWKCEGGHVHVVESRTELSTLAGADVRSIDPHRPVIDVVTFPCPKCGGVATRVEAVVDVWFDSGSMPAAQVGYPHASRSEDEFAFPADYIAEALDQTRGWFYSLLAVNVLVFGAAPYRNVLCLGLLVDGDGRKMSKSLGNVVDPWTIIDTRGVDPLRWWMLHQGSPWTSTRTSLEAIDASTSETLITLWNTWSFFATYARLEGFDPGDPNVPPPGQRRVLDRWARSRVHRTIREVTAALDDYQPLAMTTAIAGLVDDLSNWYVRRSRKRFWRTDAGVDRADALAAHATLHEALVTVALLLAPSCPFLAEVMWRHLTKAEDGGSVHLAPWPVGDDAAVADELELQVELARRVASAGRAARAEAGVRVRQPLARASVVLPPGTPALPADLVADELNVDAVDVVDRMSDVVTYELVPNFRVVGPKLGDRVKDLRAALAALDTTTAADALARGDGLEVELPGGQVSLTPDDVDVRVTALAGLAIGRDSGIVVAIDTTIDDDLRLRGDVRDVVRRVQEERKAAGLQIADRISLRIGGPQELEPFLEAIAQEVLATHVELVAPGDDGVLTVTLARA
ncbi:MAG TPA: isoleucine--tRNA ligase [Acidimicrobiales bacterium]